MKVPKKSGYAKFRQVMRISIVQLAMVIMCGGLALAYTNHAQLLDRNISITLTEVSFTEALKEIESRANISFVYSVDQLAEELSVTLQATDKPLREILDELLTPRHIVYKVYEKDATLSLKKQLPQKQHQPKIKESSSAQTQTDRLEVSGTVTDAATQQPMPGVNILVKGTTAGTTTDAAGQYTLATREDDVLVFSFIGYAAQEVPVRGRTVIDVVLSEDVVSLKDVVINAGYYNTTTLTQTGSISKVTAEEIARQPVQNPLAAIQGRVPGLEVTQSTGVPGGNFRVRIRGTNSIANGNDPLYIIDGVPFVSGTLASNETSAGILGNAMLDGGTNPLTSLNPADIESIEVLKDADATSIYGSRGANGVILITTKKGKAGKTTVSINSQWGIGNVRQRMNLLNTSQYIQMRKEAFQNDNVTPTLSTAPDLLVWDTTRYTDWQQELLGGNASFFDNQVSISGGDKNTQFWFGSGYHHETTVFPGDNSDKRLSFHSSITNASPSQKLRTTFQINYSLGKTNLLREDLTRRALTLPPNAPALRDQNNQISWENWSISFENPLAYLKRRYEVETNNLVGNFNISYNILDNLEVKSNFGLTRMSMQTVAITPASSKPPDYWPYPEENSAVFADKSFNNWIIEPQLNWTPATDKHSFNILLGATFLSQLTEGLAQSSFGYAGEALMRNIGAASFRNISTASHALYRYHAVFGRLNYQFNKKYIFNLTTRTDGSSRFGPGKQFASFGALGAAWLISEESWMKPLLSVINFAKVRTSFGTSGNDQLTDYQFMDTYAPSLGTYQNSIGLSPTRLYNPEFGWESNRKFEATLEVHSWSDRIHASISYYQNRSQNQLVGFPLPPSTGFNSVTGNFPAVVRNKGVEMVVVVQFMQRDRFSWTMSANMSIPRNTLLEFPDLDRTPGYSNQYVVGYPLSIRKGYSYIGVNPTTGQYEVEDSNQDGAYSLEDRNNISFVGQRMFGGLQNGFRYKDVQLDFLLQFVKQAQPNYLTTFSSAPGTRLNQPDFILERWQQEGDLSEIQRFTRGGQTSTAFSRYLNSNANIEDASFLRLKSIALSYSLPKSWQEKLALENARVFINCQNLFTITSYRGLDPETLSTWLPPLRVITVGMHVSF